MMDISKGRKKPKNIAIYQDTYDLIQEARDLYEESQNLPKRPSIKDTIHYIVSKYVEKTREQEKS